MVLLLLLLADPDVANLQKERVAALREAVKITKAEFVAGRVTFDHMAEVARDLLDAELDAATKPAERVAARQTYLAYAVESHKRASALHATGRLSPSAVALALAARLKAEIELRREGGKPPPDLAWPNPGKD